jgi:hypothetical protein
MQFAGESTRKSRYHETPSQYRKTNDMQTPGASNPRKSRAATTRKSHRLSKSQFEMQGMTMLIESENSSDSSLEKTFLNRNNEVYE